MRKFLELRDEGSESSKSVAAQIGYVTQILVASNRLRVVSISYFEAIVLPALKHGMLRIFFNARGEPSAFIVWALLSQSSIEKFISSGVWALHESEWNEGRDLWLLDLVAPFGSCHSVLARTTRDLFRDHPRISYVRIKEGKMRVCTIGR